MINLIAVFVSVIAFSVYVYLSVQSRLLRIGFLIISSGLFLSLVVHSVVEYFESVGSISMETLVIIMPILVSLGTALLTLGGVYIFIFVVSPLRTMTNNVTHITQEESSLNFTVTIKGMKNEISDLALAFDKLFKDRHLKLIELEEAQKHLKRTQDQLFRSEKLAAVGHLSAGIAHEINNPLAYISNNIEVLREYVQNYAKLFRKIEHLKKHITENDTEKIKLTMAELNKFEKETNFDYIMNDINGLLEETRNGTERIKKIVMDLKTFSREEQEEKRQLIKAEEIIDSVLPIVNNELKYKVELKKDYGETPFINCDIQRLGQVCINLIVNASQAIEQKGIISIKTYLQDKYVCIDIVDTGKGIPPENMKKIFDPFFTTKPVGEGTGLGLGICYEIVKNHGGEIKVQSQLGKGTTFTVLLPAN